METPNIQRRGLINLWRELSLDGKLKVIGLIVGALGLLTGTGIIKWSWLKINKAQSLIIEAGKRNGKVVYLIPSSFSNTGSQFGYLNSASAKLIDYGSSQLIGQFISDSCKVDGNKKLSEFNSFPFTEKRVTNCLFEFVQSTSSNINLEPGNVYELDITYNVTGVFTFLPIPSNLSQAYIFSVDTNALPVIVNIKDIQNGKVIHFCPLEN